ncbi:MAG TPA: VOC family protein [Candidatus Dormibacteraeota bacterium]|nr:VOC family protein [Candidatus Dormibacteraeota bacterium]
MLPSSIDAITLFVEDLEQAKLFYRRVFGLDVIYEDPNSAVFKFDVTVINLLLADAARELIAPSAVGRSDAGPRFQLTIPVADVDTTCAQLNELGVVLLNGPMNRPWGIRTASFKDPGVHIWEIAQPLKDPR